jgi:hypothetical protein
MRHDATSRGTRSLLLLFPALVLLLAEAVVPLDEFIHRGDDAFYYFQVALNHVRHGFWTFDGLHATNGVQPLWAGILTVAAHVLSWLGLSDPELAARVFVAVTAVIYFAACLTLYSLLADRVSVATGLAAAGASLFPLGVVTGRMWGMETALYLLMLLITMAYFHRRFLVRPSHGSATLLGLLLGLCALGRLNAGFFIACLLLYYVLRPAHGPLSERLRFGVVAGVAACAVVIPYFWWNAATTGHLLPISGAVKAVRSAQARADYGVQSLRNVLSMLYYGWTPGLQWLATSRLADGLWILGGRTVVDGAVKLPVILTILGGLAIGPMLLGRPREWLGFVGERFRRLSPFIYFPAYAMVDACVSILAYPSEQYAALRWWLVPFEVVLTVLAATLVVSALSYFGSRWLPERRRLQVMTAVVMVLVVAHAARFVRFYWDGKVQHPDWNLSWNDESYRAAGWVNQHLPADAIVGAWNAGVFGYFARRPVVNLDGLINNFELLPYLRERRVADYIRRERISYLSDLEPMFEAVGVRAALPVTEVYRHYSAFMRRDYVIYRVEHDTARAR